MGIESDKPVAPGLVTEEHMKMSYAQINQLYPELRQIEVDGYSTWIGGACAPWSKLNTKTENNKEQPPKITDSIVFAEFLSKHGRSLKYKQSPWKIHLSIHPVHLAKAWDIIYPVLIANNIPYFKTTRVAVTRNLFNQTLNLDDETLESAKLTQQDIDLSLQDMERVYHGMQITIYIEKDKEHFYNQLLELIEPLLYKAGIRPGVVNNSDRALGIYSSVRHVGEGYTSYEKVTGYKDVSVKDPFKLTRPHLSQLQINWNGLDYTGHIAKARLMIQQVVDARRQYDLGNYTKTQFIQLSDVALEYLKFWHKLVGKAQQQTNLSAGNKSGLLKFKKWIDDGIHLIPTLKGHNQRKVKEAEDIIDSTRKLSDPRKPLLPLLQRKPAQKNLLKFVGAQGLIGEIPPTLVKKKEAKKDKDSSGIFNRLFAARKKEFQHIKSKSLPQIRVTPFEQSTPGEIGVPPEPKVRDSLPKQINPEAIIPAISPLQAPIDKKQEFHFTHPWSLGGGVGGAVAGAFIGFIIGLPLAPITLALIMVAGLLLGAVAGFGTGYILDRARPSEPISGTDVTQEERPVPARPENRHQKVHNKASSLPVHHSWSLGLYERSNRKANIDHEPGYEFEQSQSRKGLT